MSASIENADALEDNRGLLSLFGGGDDVDEVVMMSAWSIPFEKQSLERVVLSGVQRGSLFVVITEISRVS
jgi:hypothetical protein